MVPLPLFFLTIAAILAAFRFYILCISHQHNKWDELIIDLESDDYDGRKFYLDEDKESWLTVKILRPELLALLNVEKLVEMRPANQNKVVVKHFETPAHRYYTSFGATPDYDAKATIHSHMYGSKTEKLCKALPNELTPFIKSLNQSEGYDYNQGTLTWYMNGNDYIPFHVDMGIGMKTDHISTVTLYPETGGQRDFIIKADRRYVLQLRYTRITIPTKHGMIITLHGEKAIRYFVHGSPKAPEVTTPRISLSLRTFFTDQVST